MKPDFLSPTLAFIHHRTLALKSVIRRTKKVSLRSSGQVIWQKLYTSIEVKNVQKKQSGGCYYCPLVAEMVVSCHLSLVHLWSLQKLQTDHGPQRGLVPLPPLAVCIYIHIMFIYCSHCFNGWLLIVCLFSLQGEQGPKGEKGDRGERGEPVSILL